MTSTLFRCSPNPKKSLLRPFWGFVGAFALVSLSACGGGGGGSGGGGGFALPVGAPVATGAVVAEPAPAPEPDPVCSVDLYGDSVMAGASAKGTLARTPAAELRRLLPGWTVIDHSISGDSVTLAESRVMNDTRRGSLVVFSWGINDQGQDWDVRAPLGRLVDFVKAEGRKVVITGLSQNANPKTEGTNAAELVVATSKGAAFASWNETPVETIDGTHQTQESSDALAGDLAEVLKRECR